MSTKVLVFESDAAFAAELRNELSKLGCSTSVVDDGNAGLQQASSDKPDLILLSIELPRMNGFSVCNKLKKDTKLKEVPLIIMSTESSDETFDQHRKLRTRAEDYVHKPIAFGELLSHINQFIRLEGASPPADVGIVIDDEISSIDIEEEGTLVVDQGAAAPKRVSQSPKRAASETPAKLQNVDEDIDAFIEGGFGKMQSRGGGEAPQNGTSAEAKKKSVAPPPVPTAPVDDGRIAELEKELSAAREEAAQLRADFDSRIEAEQRKMEAELEEVRGKLATAGKGGVSSREFLDLREALNKKDKEILALKEHLGKKDKEIVDVREKALAFERTKADLDDKMLATLREIEEQKERAEALARDKDQAKKASEDFKNRLAKVQGELETRINDLNETRARQAALQTELETRTKELEDARVKVAEDAQAHEAAAAAARADHEGTVARQQAELAAATEAAQNEKTAALDAAQQKAAADLTAAVAAREAELKAESDSRLGALHRAHQEEVGRVRAEHAQEKEALAARHTSETALAQAKHEEESEEAKNAASALLAAREAELESKSAAEAQRAEQRRTEEVSAIERDRDEKVAAAERERDERVAAAVAEREAAVAAAVSDRDERVAAALHERDERVAAVESVASERVAAANRDRDEAVAALRTEISQLSEAKQLELAQSAARIGELERHGSELAQVREQLDRDLATSKDRLLILDAETAALRTELAEARAAFARETSRADKAYAKWEADRTALERAKDALAVVLSQIEDAEGRSIS